MRVLIVAEEDAVMQRATSALHLRPEVEVEEFRSAREAAARVWDGAFDVLVVDGDLQPKGGFSLLYELRAEAAQRGAQRPPAVVLIDREQDRFLADWAGAEEVMRKPVDPFELVAAVTELAERSAATA